MIQGAEPSGAAMATIDQARAVKLEAAALVARVGDVVGVGITRVAGEYGVKVNLRQAPPEGTDLPCSVGGVPVWVEVVGAVAKRTAG